MYFRTAQKLNNRQARWSLYLSEIKLIHLPGLKMIQSNTLSWWPDHRIEGRMEEEEMIMLPENMFINLLDTDYKKEYWMEKNWMQMWRTLWKHYHKKDLQLWRTIWKIGKLTKLMEGRQYFTKNRTTFLKTRNYYEMWSKCTMIMKQLDTLEN